jgi:hypothetical protein
LTSVTWTQTSAVGAKAIRMPSASASIRSTGRMAGDYPKSFWKIAFLVLIAIIIFFVVLMLTQE